jgi:hypothetical protein
MTTEHDDEILHRVLELDVEEPAVQIVEIVADLEDEEPTHLSQIWDCSTGCSTWCSRTLPRRRRRSR